jgi:imidazolonepropionase-like amidohydrolase
VQGDYRQGKNKKVPMIDMELMQQTGMAPMQILVAATKNGACACGKSGEFGTIEPGKSTDILVVQGNPLDDLRKLQDLRLVLKNGAIIRREER